MGRVYSVEVANITVSGLGTQRRLLTIMWEAASSAIMRLLKVHVGSGDVDTNEQMRVDIGRITGTFTPGVGNTAITPTPYDGGDTAAVSVARGDFTTNPTALTETGVALDLAGAASLTGFNFEARQGMEPIASGDEGFVVTLIDVLSVALTIRVFALYEEIGLP